MSAGDAYSRFSAHQVPNRRTTASIQNEILVKRQRNAVSKVFHSKVDKDKITGWKGELNRILQIFNVRSVDLVWHSLSGRSSD